VIAQHEESRPVPSDLCWLNVSGVVASVLIGGDMAVGLSGFGLRPALILSSGSAHLESKIVRFDVDAIS
jgi:hypothetical protein